MRGRERKLERFCVSLFLSSVCGWKAIFSIHRMCGKSYRITIFMQIREGINPYDYCIDTLAFPTVTTDMRSFLKSLTRSRGEESSGENRKEPELKLRTLEKGDFQKGRSFSSYFLMESTSMFLARSDRYRRVQRPACHLFQNNQHRSRADGSCADPP